VITIATGPRSNGTSLLYRILCTASEGMPLHIPAFPPWLRPNDWATDFPTALFVVIYRYRNVAAKSLVARNLQATYDEAHAEQNEARAYLGWQLGKLGDRAYVVTYEDLIGWPMSVTQEIDAFLRRHGYKGEPLSLPEPICDENAKWAA
jgi:hypothetical protein